TNSLENGAILVIIGKQNERFFPENSLFSAFLKSGVDDWGSRGRRFESCRPDFYNSLPSRSLRAPA
ncbi:MAG: hypothetical protein WD066_18810, partial [Planctomycetaceae bacterium]